MKAFRENLNTLCRNVHTGPRQRQGPRPIVSYCTSSVSLVSLVSIPCYENKPLWIGLGTWAMIRMTLGHTFLPYMHTNMMGVSAPDLPSHYATVIYAPRI